MYWMQSAAAGCLQSTPTESETASQSAFTSLYLFIVVKFTNLVTFHVFLVLDHIRLITSQLDLYGLQHQGFVPQICDISGSPSSVHAANRSGLSLSIIEMFRT